MRVDLLSLLLYYKVSFQVVSPLQCLQCARLEGWPTVCPDDGILETLDVWDACMTWTLDNGTTVLQNFVMADEDCTEDRLEFWGKKYLDIVWNTTGIAECCYDDGCNDNRESTTQSEATSRIATTSGVNQDTTVETTRDTTQETALDAALSVTPYAPVKTTLHHKDSENGIECDHCKDIQFSECLSPEHTEWKSFAEMIKKIAKVNTNEKCSCKAGFLPLYTEKILRKCVDPIVKTSCIYGRCLVPEHCAGLTYSECLPDMELSGYPGFEDYKTCQCGDNFNTAEVDIDGLITECLPLDDMRESVCGNDVDCSLFGNALCSIGERVATETEDKEVIKDEEISTEERPAENDEESDSTNETQGYNNNNNNNGRSKREEGVCYCAIGYVYEINKCSKKRIDNLETVSSENMDKDNIVQECLDDSDCSVTNSFCKSKSNNHPKATPKPSENTQGEEEEPVKCTGGTNTNCNNGVCTVTCSGNNNNNNNNNGRQAREAEGVCQCEPGYKHLNDKSGLLMECLFDIEVRPEIQFGFVQDLPVPSDYDDKSNRLTGVNEENEEREGQSKNEISDIGESPKENSINGVVPTELTIEIVENPLPEEPMTHEGDIEKQTTLSTEKDNEGVTTVNTNEGITEFSPILEAPIVGIQPENINQGVIENGIKEEEIDLESTTEINNLDALPIQEETKPESGLESCRLEFSEGTTKPFTEPITQASISVFHLKWDSHPRNGDGAVVRLYHGLSKERFYSLHILKSRTVSVSVGTSSGGRIRVRQVAVTKANAVVNSLYWSEWWVAYKSGMVLIGTVKDHGLTNPLLAWIDHDQPLPSVEMLELVGYRTKVTFKADCYENILRSDACAQDSDCIKPIVE